MDATTMDLELTFTLEPETLEGGFTRYTSRDLPGFRVLCEPKESPIPLIEQAAPLFIPAAISACMNNKLVLKGLRIKSAGAALFGGMHAPIALEAHLAHV